MPSQPNKKHRLSNVNIASTWIDQIKTNIIHDIPEDGVKNEAMDKIRAILESLIEQNGHPKNSATDDPILSKRAGYDSVDQRGNENTKEINEDSKSKSHGGTKRPLDTSVDDVKQVAIIDITNEVKFFDLTKTSQSNLLNKNSINYFGINTDLTDLKFDEKMMDSIDSETLQKLIYNQEITIGNPLFNDNLIQQNINDVIDHEKLRHIIEKKDNILLIENMSEEEFQHEVHYKSSDEIESFRTDLRVDESKRIIIASNFINDLDFKKFCMKNHDKISTVYLASYDREKKFELQKLFDPKTYQDRRISKISKIYDPIKLSYKLSNSNLNENYIFIETEKKHLLQVLPFDSVEKLENFEKNCRDGRIKFLKDKDENDFGIRKSMTHLIMTIDEKESKIFVLESGESFSSVLDCWHEYKKLNEGVNEKEFTKKYAKESFILSVDVGVGKSTLFKKLAREEMMKDQSKLVIFIDLRDCNDAIKCLTLKIHDETFIKFIKKIKSLNLDTTTAKLMIESRFKSGNKDDILLFFDGFDEINYENESLTLENKRKFIEFLKYLQDKAITRVSTRPSALDISQKDFPGIFIKLEKFNHDERISYLESLEFNTSAEWLKNMLAVDFFGNPSNFGLLTQLLRKMNKNPSLSVPLKIDNLSEHTFYDTCAEFMIKSVYPDFMNTLIEQCKKLAFYKKFPQ